MGLSGWNNSKKLGLTLDSSKVDEDLTNFPVNITLSSGTGQTGFDATAVFDELSTVSGTKKIAVTTTVSGVETELYTEIERWDWGAEEANLWVKIPTVSSGTDTELYLYYDSDHADNTSYVGDTGDAAAQSVWNSGFKAIYHMAQDPNGDVADSIKDSTSNANHGTPNGTMTSADLVDGKIGKAIEFDGSNDGIGCGNGTSLQITGNITVENLLKFSASQDNKTIFGKWGTDEAYLLNIPSADNNKLQFVIRVSESNKVAKSVNTYNNGLWHQVAGIFDGTNVIIDVDGGTEIVTGDATSGPIQNPGSGVDLYFGEYNNGAGNILAVIGESRISNVVRSAAWRKATYYSNWNDFVTFNGAVGFVFTNPTPAHLSIAYGTTKQLYLTTTISGEEPNYVYDASFYDSFDVQIGTAVSGIQSGQPAESNAYLSTPSGIDYSWYMIATSSGSEDTSDTYTFHNRFLASGTTEINGTLASGIDVRLYLRDTGELLGSTTSTISGIFDIETQHNAEFYCVALSPYTDTNSLIYDFLEVD